MEKGKSKNKEAEDLYKEGKIHEMNRSDKEAIECYRKSAELGHNKALYRLGYCYYFYGTENHNFKKAVECFTKAAHQGHVCAQYYLGGCYRSGQGVEMDIEEAMKWFTMAAEQGNADAQYELGQVYLVLHVNEEQLLAKAKNHTLNNAKKWLSKAAEQNHIEATELLDELIKNGK
jgi:TPR repeat protein